LTASIYFLCYVAPSSDEITVPEIQGTTQEVARAKCREAAEKVIHLASFWFSVHFVIAASTKTQSACITEDTALCFAALNGLPGPYIKYFLEGLGHQGLNELLTGFPTKAAWALCTFAYSAGPGRLWKKQHCNVANTHNIRLWTHPVRRPDRWKDRARPR
jgi:inosine triphosphate pyrophosphatase